VALKYTPAFPGCGGLSAPDQACGDLFGLVRDRTKMDSEMPKYRKSDLFDGVDIFAVKQKDIEAGRKGQHGQYAKQHDAIIGVPD
jgi:hypothetical protein